MVVIYVFLLEGAMYS